MHSSLGGKRTQSALELGNSDISPDSKRARPDTSHDRGPKASTLSSTGAKGEVVSSSANPFIRYSAVCDYWNGLDKLTDIIVFGDSHSRFPGCTTWLGYLLKLLNDKYDNTRPHITASNFAAPGHSVEDDLSGQLADFFTQFPKKSEPRALPALDPSTTLYVFWLGSNDCGQSEADDLEDMIDILFSDGLDDIYVKAGGRNFLLIDVPPKDRCPGAIKISDEMHERCALWNTVLEARARAFAEDSNHASVFLFSAHAAFANVLDHPSDFGFQKEDVTTEGGTIWLDELHFTSSVHAVLADQLKRTLCNMLISTSIPSCL